MGVEGEVLVARRLIMLLTNRGQFEQLEDAYCRLRPHLSPTAAVARTLVEQLPSSEHEAIIAFISGEGEDPYSSDDLPPVHHSFIDGLECLYEQRQTSEQHEQRERMDAAQLAADLAGDSQLAQAYWEGRQEAPRWLEHFSSIVRQRASANPTPTGQRLIVDRALDALATVKGDYQARGGDEAEAQVEWCLALEDRLAAGGGASGDGPADQAVRDRGSDEVDDVIATAPSPAPTTPSAPILDLLRSAASSLGDEYSFTALIEAANGHDDDYDPSDESTVEAMRSLLEEEGLEPGGSGRADVGGRVRNELWTHMVFGHRVGRYLLTTHGRRSSSSESRSRSYTASDLVSYVGRARSRKGVEDIMSGPDLGAALHYHALSSVLLRACGEDRTRARALVRLVEDLGFLTALGVEELTHAPTVHVGEPRPRAVRGPVGTPPKGFLEWPEPLAETGR